MNLYNCFQAYLAIHNQTNKKNNHKAQIFDHHNKKTSSTEDYNISTTTSVNTAKLVNPTSSKMDDYCSNFDCTISLEVLDICYDFVKGPTDVNCHLYCDLRNCTKVPNSDDLCVVYTCWPTKSTTSTSTTSSTTSTTTTTSTTATTTSSTTTSTSTTSGTTTTTTTTSTATTTTSTTPIPIPASPASVAVALSAFILIFILAIALFSWLKKKERSPNQVSNLIGVVLIIHKP